MDSKEVAARIRKDLKVRFAGTKFTVRISRYSMGSSVSVNWTDGPSSEQVREVSCQYDFYQFDGMQDLHSTADARVIDGELLRASCSISASREYSEAACLLAIGAVRAFNMAGVDADALSVGGSAAWGFRVDSREADSYDYWSGWSLAQRALQEWTAYPAPVAAQKLRVRVWSDGTVMDQAHSA